MKVRELDHIVQHLSNRVPGWEHREMGSIKKVIQEKRLRVKTTCYWLYVKDEI